MARTVDTVLHGGSVVLGAGVEQQDVAIAGDKIGAIAWRPLVFILGANLLFGALLVGLPSIGLPHFGLIVAIYGLVILAGYARQGCRLRDSLILATLLAIGSYLAFVKLLNLQFPVLPWFLSN